MTLLSAFIMVEPQPGSNPAQCQADVQFAYYDVHGDTQEAIERSLRERGPRDDRGAVRFARTTWSIKWQWDKANTTQVDLSTLSLSCRATVTLPRLIITQQTPHALIKSWHAFVEKTRQHELSHLQHAEGGAPRIRQHLDRLVATQGPLTPAQANAEVLKIIDEIREMDRQYDHRTNHGFTEGTWRLESAEQTPHTGA